MKLGTANAMWFMDDVAQRLANRVQLTSDGHKAYLEAVEGAFGADVDYMPSSSKYMAPHPRARRAATALRSAPERRR